VQISGAGSNFVFPFGQAISRTTYATLFGLFSTTFGSGDGSTTFNIPDLRGRIIAGKDDMGGSAASRLTATYFGTSAAVLGATGGTESYTIVTANLPPYTPSGSVASSISPSSNYMRGGSSAQGGGAVDGALSEASPIITSTFTGNAQGGTSTPHKIVQPTIIANKLLRVL
jgi:microcystin-dependent protein